MSDMFTPVHNESTPESSPFINTIERKRPVKLVSHIHEAEQERRLSDVRTLLNNDETLSPMSTDKATAKEREKTGSVAQEDALAEMSEQLANVVYQLNCCQLKSEREKAEKDSMIRDLTSELEAETKRAEILELDRRFLFEKQKEQALEIVQIKEEKLKAHTESEQSRRVILLENDRLKDCILDLENDFAHMNAKFAAVTQNAKDNQNTLSTIGQDMTTLQQSLNRLITKSRVDGELLEQSASSSYHVPNIETMKLNVKRKIDETDINSTSSRNDGSAAFQKIIDEQKEKILGLDNQIKLLAPAHGETSSMILQLRDNPAARHENIKYATLEKLERANKDLLDQLEGKVVDVVPISVLTALRIEIENCHSEVAEKEKRMLRLKEIWAAKSSEFREAVYSLLGYRFDFLQNGCVRVVSMYAAKTNQAFIFDGENSTMRSVGEYADNPELRSTLESLVKFWIGEKNSVPGLLSSLTLELIERQTQ